MCDRKNFSEINRLKNDDRVIRYWKGKVIKLSEFFECENGILLNYNGTETIVTVPENIHTIGDNAFKGRTKIEKIVLPESVKHIGNNAFKGCKMLSEINFPDVLEDIGDYAFHRCHSLKAAILPDSLKSLGICAFLYCDGMERVSIKGIKKLGRHTFTNDTSLREIWLNTDLDISNLSDDILIGCVKIQKIGLSDGSVFTFDNLINVMRSDNTVHPIVRAVAAGVYQSMQIEDGSLHKFNVNLKNFELPEGISSIEKGCFYDKKGIVSLTFPKSLQKIEANAFGNCINLNEITIQSKELVIGERAFEGCNNLTTINLYNGKSYSLESFSFDASIPPMIRKISEQVWSDFYIAGKVLMEYRGNEERVTIPDGIRIIAEGCFAGNEAIGRVILPDSITEIQENAFKNCVSLQTIRLSENLRLVEKGAFENCRKLLKIILPETTEKLGESAFKRCQNLNLFQMNKNIKEIGDMAFYGCSQLKNMDIPTQTKISGSLTFFNCPVNFCISENTKLQQAGTTLFDSDINENTSFTTKYNDSENARNEKSISPYQFCGDETVTELHITEECRIGKYAFSSCRNLSILEITNPDCIIAEFAFEKCENLKTVKLDVKNIGKGAFAFCRELENVIINGAENLGAEAFFGCIRLSDISLSDTVKGIGKRCFEECFSLKKFPLEHIKTVGERAFARCEGFETVSLPALNLYRHAFEDCHNLKRIEISSQTYRKSQVFFGCTNVNEIIMDGESYTFDAFQHSMNNISNTLPEIVQEIIGDIYSCFQVSKKNELLSYRGNARSIKIPEDIISLEDEAFRECLRLEDLYIPQSVKYIGRLTFAGTGWLDIMKKKNKMTVVNNLLVEASECGETIEIPKEIRRICSWAFAGNDNLREIRFSSEQIIVDEFAFRNCFNVRKITMADGQTYTLHDIHVRKDDTLPDMVRQIFTDCINCFKTDEEDNLLVSTGNIKNLTFVKGIKSIGKEVYKDCKLLESITLTEDTERIGNNAFENGKWLREVKNAVGVKEIGDFAFSGCQSLEKIELSDSLRILGKRSFEHCCMLREILIPEGVTEIKERTFFRCKNLKKVTLPSTLKSIGKEAFAFCENLEEVVIPEGLETLGERAFAWCGKLDSRGDDYAV